MINKDQSQEVLLDRNCEKTLLASWTAATDSMPHLQDYLYLTYMYFKLILVKFSQKTPLKYFLKMFLQRKMGILETNRKCSTNKPQIGRTDILR